MKLDRDNDNSVAACLRNDVGCGQLFTRGRHMNTVLLCGRGIAGGGLACDGALSLPCGCRKLTKHIACTFGSACFTRFGVKCGNSRGFTGKRQFKFFPTCTIN